MGNVMDINCFRSVTITGKKTNEGAVRNVEFQ